MCSAEISITVSGTTTRPPYFTGEKEMLQSTKLHALMADLQEFQKVQVLMF